MAENQPTIQWEGASGAHYTYWISSLATFSGKVAAGNYIFAKEDRPGYWLPVYIGETIDFSTRFDNHHKIECIRRNGATHIHTHTTATEKARLDEETDLIRKWTTSCND